MELFEALVAYSWSPGEPADHATHHREEDEQRAAARGHGEPEPGLLRAPGHHSALPADIQPS